MNTYTHTYIKKHKKNKPETNGLGGGRNSVESIGVGVKLLQTWFLI